MHSEISALDDLIEAVRDHRDTLAQDGRYTRRALLSRADMGRAAMKVWDDGLVAPDIDNCEHEARPFVPEEDTWKDDDTWKDMVPETGALHPCQAVSLMPGSVGR